MPAHAESVHYDKHHLNDLNRTDDIQRMQSTSSSEDDSTYSLSGGKKKKLIRDVINELSLVLLKHQKGGVQGTCGPQAAICPLSIAVVLLALDLGAFGQTGKELRQLLHIPEPTGKLSKKSGGKENRTRKILGKLYSFSSQDDINIEEIHMQVEKLLKHFSDLPSKAMSISTGIFPPKHHQHTNISRSYKKIIKEMFQTTVEKLDFQNDVEECVKFINGWVSRRTSDKIKEVVSIASVDPASSLLLINTTYFGGSWNSEFDASSTHDRDFTFPNGSVSKIPFMFKKDQFDYSESEELDCQCLQLDCATGEFAFYAILPKACDGLAALESKLTSANLDQLLSTKKQEIVLYLPKFKIEQNLPLKRTLFDLGVKELFLQGKADLSGIDRRGNLYVSEMMHKVYFNVDEEGASGAAATTVVLKAACGGRQRKYFDANHPFLFLVREQVTDITTFIGRFCGDT